MNKNIKLDVLTAALEGLKANIVAAAAPAVAPMDTFTACMICEGVEMAGTVRQLQAWQHLIDTGTVWSLQGTYGRIAASLIEQGYCHDPRVEANRRV